MSGRQTKRMRKAFMSACLAQNVLPTDQTKIMVREKKYSWSKTTFELYNEERRLFRLFKKEWLCKN